MTHQGPPDSEFHSLDGTIQRVNHRTRELRIIADGRVWELALSNSCRFWFNGRPAPFRCFQPLDNIRVEYSNSGDVHVATAMYLRCEEIAPVLDQPNRVFERFPPNAQRLI